MGIQSGCPNFASCPPPQAAIPLTATLRRSHALQGRPKAEADRSNQFYFAIFTLRVLTPPPRP